MEKIYLNLKFVKVKIIQLYLKIIEEKIDYFQLNMFMENLLNNYFQNSQQKNLKKKK